MIINKDTLDLVFKGFKSVYTDAYMEAANHADKIVMRVPSSARDETYGWLGQFPQLREWIGDRHIHGLKAHGFTIENREFESTVEVPRNDIMDDRIGVFKPMFSEMGRLAKSHTQDLVFGLLKSGFDTECFDGQPFFDEDHPLEINKRSATVSNMQTGSSAPWFLLDTSRAVRPIIFQEREPYTFEGVTDPEDARVFATGKYLYGVRARVNAGFGLWQLAFGSKAELNASNYAAARAAMMDFRSDGGRILGVAPTVLVAPPSLEEKALQLLNATHDASGATNVWAKTADLVITPYVKV